MIPFVDLERTYEPIRDEILAAVRQVLDSQTYIDGPAVREFEFAVADELGVEHAIGVSSGSDALLAALMALDVGPGDEVVTTPLTFVSTAEAICRVGARPVFADVEPDTYNLDPTRVAERIGPDTRAILPVHLFGQTCRMDPLLEVADTHGIPLVEDAAQAIGSTYGDRPAGTFGAAGCFSFYPTKNLGGIGDGGLVVTDDDELAARVRQIAHHGRDADGEFAEIGGNFRLDSVNAAALGAKLPHLSAWNDARRAAAARYDDALESNDAVAPPARLDEAHHTFHQYAVRATDRPELRRRLEGDDIGYGIYYERPIYRYEAYRAYAPDPACTTAERLTDELLALPIFPGLTDSELNRVAATVNKSG